MGARISRLLGVPAGWGLSALRRQRGHLFPWVPVCFGLGIALYFALPYEPVPEALLFSALMGGGLLLFCLRMASDQSVLPLVFGLVLLGLAVAGGRAHLVAAPQLAGRYYGPIEGRVVQIDRARSDALRLTLDDLRLQGLPADHQPRRVRIALHGDPDVQARVLQPAPGQRVMLTGHLLPPGDPVEPGGFDFRRHAWFQELGGVGYTRTPVLLLAPPEGGQYLFRTRMALSRHVQAQLPGEIGAFAAALMTGDRSAMGQETLEALRHSNLAHLLAISGLHMGLLAGFVFAALRIALLLPRRSRHHWPGKKIAAVGALLAAAAYMALSGGNVATQRAFIMVAVMLGAVLADLRALSLRAVALAALIVLTLRPEALLGPGFQMSFAATTALVRVFESAGSGRLMRLAPVARPLVTLLLSSATASLATVPFSMAHFNILSRYGLLANLLAVPAMGLVAVPMAVLSALLLPFGLDALALQGMALALRWILTVAERVSALQGAVVPVVAPAPAVLPLLIGGGLLVLLWQGRGRWMGAVPVLAGAFLWMETVRPLLLISETGRLVGLMTEEGRALSRNVGSGFVAESWLENDGQAGGQPAAAALWPVSESKLRRAATADQQIVHVIGAREAQKVTGCAGATILVSSAPMLRREGCMVFDPVGLQVTGAVALYEAPDGIRIEAAKGPSARLWQSPAVRRDQ
ncbi:competence protein [Salipiger sp. CCB-MM3]|uniref:ComEC/Rec2 family competence protein n=1 Tax=Salipiger sp. CCB-MM3 TaxID=1792508 RepID=UPI00080AA869|nr:ComEC/Rec2 family competence protein [Salipiger sp. CCB-MM3]ANT59119.1 competence protein [Salipiger sp. CCB-MM3]